MIELEWAVQWKYSEAGYNSYGIEICESKEAALEWIEEGSPDFERILICREVRPWEVYDLEDYLRRLS